MEEDIKILEEYIELTIGNRPEWVKSDEILKIIDYKQIQSIENLIKGYRELEEEIKQAQKWLNYYKIGETVEEFEEIVGNTPINDIEKIKKYIFQKYIPKSKIKEKIEELDKGIRKIENKKVWNEPVDTITRNRLCNYYNALQELMEDK